MKSASLILIVLLIPCFPVSAQLTAAEIQIQEAIKALPDDSRANAKVLGYNLDGNLIVLQKGGSGFVCLADDPNKKGFNVSCYPKDLEPFMARGRELQKQSKTYKEIFDIREKEAKNGKLKMPKNPATLHVLSGESVDNANYRYVVYIPWATAKSTGLPIKEVVPGAPWIMDPGTHRAHIMISPPKRP